MPNDSAITTAMQGLFDAADALVDEAKLARDIRTSNAEKLGVLLEKVGHLDDAVTSARVESAGAIAAAQASVSELRDSAAMYRRMIYVGSSVLVAMTVTLLYAVLTLRGLDADAALAAGTTAAGKLIPGNSTITVPADTTITTTPPEVDDGK